jgi:putative hydrolase of the HAD superfamily
VIDKFDFTAHINRLNQSNLLHQSRDLDLHQTRCPTWKMGAIYEELIRRSFEAENDTAGEHFIPREVIQLMQPCCSATMTTCFVRRASSNAPTNKQQLPELPAPGPLGSTRDDPSMADVVFFDLDGTLVDHRSAVFATIAQIIQAAPNATAPPEELVKLWWTLEGRHMREYLAGRCSFAEHHRRRLRSFLPMLGEPVPEDPGLLDAWIAERYLTLFAEACQSYPDVRPCLEALRRLPRGPRLAVLTNGDPGQQRAKLARSDLLGYFEAVLTPPELGAAKPGPVAYVTACRWMGADPAQAVNVGDMLESDVNAAALAGLTGIWLDRGIDFVTGGPSPTADETVLRIERLTDLPGHLSSANA